MAVIPVPSPVPSPVAAPPAAFPANEVIARVLASFLSLASLVLTYFVGLAVAYLGIFILKSLLKSQLGDTYRRGLRLVVSFVVALLTTAAYFATHNIGTTLAVFLGAVSAPLLHDVIDGLAPARRGSQ